MPLARGQLAGPRLKRLDKRAGLGGPGRRRRVQRQVGAVDPGERQVAVGRDGGLGAAGRVAGQRHEVLDRLVEQQDGRPVDRLHGGRPSGPRK